MSRLLEGFEINDQQLFCGGGQPRCQSLVIWMRAISREAVSVYKNAQQRSVESQAAG